MEEDNPRVKQKIWYYTSEEDTISHNRRHFHMNKWNRQCNVATRARNKIIGLYQRSIKLSEIGHFRGAFWYDHRIPERALQLALSMQFTTILSWCTSGNSRKNISMTIIKANGAQVTESNLQGSSVYPPTPTSTGPMHEKLHQFPRLETERNPKSKIMATQAECP